MTRPWFNQIDTNTYLCNVVQSLQKQFIDFATVARGSSVCVEGSGQSRAALGRALGFVRSAGRSLGGDFQLTYLRKSEGKSHRAVLLWEKSPPKTLRMKTCSFLLDTYFHLWCRLGDMSLFISMNETRWAWMRGRQPLEASWRIPFCTGEIICFKWLTKAACLFHLFSNMNCKKRDIELSKLSFSWKCTLNCSPHLHK